MPAPGETRAGAHDGRAARSDLGGDLRADRDAASRRSPTRLNRLQFLTIRQYLSVVFAALVALLLVLAGRP